MLEVRSNPTAADFQKRSYFYGMVKVELGEGFKPMTEVFNPSWKDDQCSLCVVEVPLPMGMVIEESATMKGRIEVLLLPLFSLPPPPPLVIPPLQTCRCACLYISIIHGP